jgi:hypothetical protein
MLASKAWAYPRVELMKNAFLQQAPASLNNIEKDRKELPDTNPS